MPGGQLKRWLRAHQGERPLADALALVQSAYAAALRRRSDFERPAIAGGRPVRLIPLPPPRPFSRSEWRAMREAVRAQGTSFFDAEMVQRFEAMLRERFGVKHALAVSSGTSALHVALMAAGVGPGDEVIVPVMTYVAVPLAVMHAGATPVFVDADPDSWNIDATLIEDAINERTRAILPVHIGGVPCEMDAILALARKHELRVIEDAAHAHGSFWNGKALGSLGDLGCFSFGSPKSITTGEGGAVLTDDDELARRARVSMNLGEVTRDGLPSLDLQFYRPELRLDYESVGWNYRMGVAQAALGVGQLERFDRIRERRVANARCLIEGLQPVAGVSTQVVPSAADPCYYTLPLRIEGSDGKRRGELLRGLAAEKIDYRLWSNTPLNEYELFGKKGEFPRARTLCATTLGLRVDPVLTERECVDMLTAIQRLLRWIDHS